MAFTGCVLVPVRQHVPLCGVGVVGNAAGVHGLWGLCLAHCWVLRQQDLFAAMQRALLVFLLFLLPVLAAVPVWGGGGLVDGVVV